MEAPHESVYSRIRRIHHVNESTILSRTDVGRWYLTKLPVSSTYVDLGDDQYPGRTFSMRREHENHINWYTERSGSSKADMFAKIEVHRRYGRSPASIKAYGQSDEEGIKGTLQVSTTIGFYQVSSIVTTALAVHASGLEAPGSIEIEPARRRIWTESIRSDPWTKRISR